MSFRPDIRFFTISDDITDDVIGFDYGHGVNIFSSQTGYARLEPGGQMLLENWDDAWGVAELDALGTLEMRVGATVLCRCVVLEYEFNRRDRLVRCTLGTPTAAAQLGDVIINAGSVPGAAGMSLTLAEVLTASGVTITPEEPLSTALNMDQGTVYEAGIPQFLSDFAVAADGFVYEDHLGAWRFLSWADSRPHTIEFTPAHFWIEDDTAESHLRSGWRRDAQLVTTLDITFIDDGGTFNSGQQVRNLGYWQVHNSRTRTIHMTPLREVGGITYNQDEDKFAYHRVFGTALNVTNRPPPFDGSFPDDWFIQTIGNSYINPDDPKELLATVRLTGDVSGSDWDSLWIQSNYGIQSNFYPDSFTENKLRLLARDDQQTVLGARPDMPWPVDDAALPGLGARIIEWSERVPRVTKLCFPLIQHTEDRFNALVGHRIGSKSSIDINLNGLDIAGFMANLYVRWRYQRSDYSCVEMHFLQLQEHAAQRPLFADDDNQLFAETGVPIYVES